MNLETARKAKGLTQTELDEKANLTRGTVSDIERGKNKKPAWETVCKIAAILERPPLEIFPVELPEKDSTAA